MKEAAKLAQRFHEAYERLAPQFGYETRKESAKPWSEVPEQNKRLMTAVCAEIMDATILTRNELLWLANEIEHNCPSSHAFVLTLPAKLRVCAGSSEEPTK